MEKSLLDNKEQLRQLKAIEKSIRIQLGLNLTDQAVLKIEIYKQETGFEIGDKIKLGEKLGELIDIRFYYKRLTPIVKLFKKDGKLGSREYRVHSWHKFKKA